jgi:hypothetical protein
VRKACFARVYELPLETGTVYSIDVQSRQFDAFVRLENSRGSNLFVDDNSGGGGNARLLFRVSASGVYRVVVTSFEPDATGNFVLTVRRASAPDKASSE